MTKDTHPEVFIVESLRFEDEDRAKEGEVLARTLRMSGKNPVYHYVRTRKELEHFVDEFRKSKYRYFHLSCHSEVNLFSMTLDYMTASELADVFGTALERRRLFLSTCFGADRNFAKKIFKRSGCYSVVGPVGGIDFDNAALLWANFYHLMFRENAKAMKREPLIKNLTAATLIVREQMRAFTRTPGGKTIEYFCPPAK